MYAQQCVELTSTNRSCVLTDHKSLPILLIYLHICPGDQREVATPVPIPNTEVKHLIGDDTAEESVGK